MLLALCEQFTLFYKGSACKSSANLDDIAVSKTPVYNPTWYQSHVKPLRIAR